MDDTGADQTVPIALATSSCPRKEVGRKRGRVILIGHIRRRHSFWTNLDKKKH